MIIANANGIYILLNENSFKYLTIAIMETTALAIKYNLNSFKDDMSSSLLSKIILVTTNNDATKTISIIRVKFFPDIAISTRNPENNKNTTYVISVNSLLFFTL